MRYLKSNKDIKEYREELFNLQNGIDPILGVLIKDPVLDHDHKTGKSRKVLDREINQFLGKLESNYIRFVRWKFPNIPLYQILLAIGNYLKEHESNPSEVYHPDHKNIMVRWFKTLDARTQKNLLFTLDDKLIVGKTESERIKQFKKRMYAKGT